MFLQFQSLDKRFTRVGSENEKIFAYANDDEAKKNFFDSLTRQTYFIIDELCKIKILSVKRIEEKSSYLEFSAIGDLYNEINVPVTGLVSFSIPKKITIVRKLNKTTILKKNRN